MCMDSDRPSGRVPVRTLGKLMVIWGMLLPLIPLPYSPIGTYPAGLLVNIPLTFLGSGIGSLILAYEDIVAGALVLIGFGVSFIVLPERQGGWER
jgi:hypothetical protein